MNAIQLLKRRLLSIPIELMIRDAAEANKDVIEDMNSQQLLKGTYTSGRDITPTYRNPIYAAAKQFMNARPKPGVPDIKLTGAYHESITATVTGGGISMEATDEKAQDLEDKYGNELIGLSEESRGELAHGYIKPHVLEQVYDYLSRWRQ